MTSTIFIIVVFLTVAFVFVFMKFAPQLGQVADGERLKRIQASPHYKKGKFQNIVETNMEIPPKKMMKIFWDMQMKGRKNEPEKPVANVPFDREQFMANEDETVICWFGHSSILIKINGLVLLIDPVFSERASTFSFLGPKKFPYIHDISVEELPHIDAIILSHDHYDHLDYKTILKLRGKVDKYYTPLGVGGHLERWGIAAESITELDWWETVNLEENVKLTATPNRHFSGRSFSRNKTLWCSYVLEGRHKIFLGADSGYFSGFETIGEKYGPFDLTLLECGAYNKLWEAIHMLPEQTAKAHRELKGKVLMPIHWGKFNLALHHWIEPMQRLEEKTKAMNIDLITPKPHELVVLDKSLPKEKWWKEYAG